MSESMTRRQFVATTGAGLAAMASHGEEEGPGTRPNVLLIHADQHRMECLGAYGNADIRTPNIDALAADGVRFDNSFCPYPVCTPSRYSLLCGQYVHQHRGWTNHSTLAPEIDTFPRVLKNAGYRTKAVGKMHFTPTYLDVGFQEMNLSEQNGPGRWDDDYHRMLRDAGLVDYNDLEDQERIYRNKARPEYKETFGALPSNLPEKYHATQWTGDRAAETLEGWDASRHLLMVGFIKPHHPFDPPHPWCDAYNPDSLSLLPGWTDACLPRDLALSKGYFPHEKLSDAALRRVMAYYYANIAHIDREVGRMIGILKRKGLYENTMIIYTSDHGEYMGYHHMLLKGNHQYDALAKVPLIVKYPGQRDKGTVSQSLVSNVDVAPTILETLSCATPASMVGQSLCSGSVDREIVFAEASRGKRAMARSKTRKLLLSHENEQGLFFDLEKDPFELDNRYTDPAYREEVQAFTEAIHQWRSFDSLERLHLDERAPVIDQPNVPSRDDNHRKEMMDYCKAKMREA